MVDDARRRFRDRIRSLIAGGPEGGLAGTEVHRGDVEAIGESLGMSPDEACGEFLALKGDLWEFGPGGSFTTHTAHSAEDGPYPRNWSALKNVVVLLV